MLSELAFWSTRVEQSVWMFTQKYNTVLNLCEHTHWVALFHCKDRGNFENFLCKNDII